MVDMILCGISATYCSTKMKSRIMTGNLEKNEKVLNYESPTKTRQLDDKQQQVKNASQKLNDRYGDNYSRLKKNIENVSSLHNKDFYNHTLSVDKKDRPVCSYEIDNIKDYDNFNLNDMKSTFAKNRIHIYDINLQGQVANGNQSGKVCFKVRQNEDDAEFHNKIGAISKDIRNKGYSIKQKSDQTAKPR